MIEEIEFSEATLYRSSVSNDEFIQKVAEELLDAESIIPSKSSFASPVWSPELKEARRGFVSITELSYEWKLPRPLSGSCPMRTIWV